MGETGKYIYGVISSSKELSFGPCGVAACEEVYTIPYQDISAVVSDSEVVDYTHIPKDAVARLLVRHQKAIERIISQEYTVIPMRLGTFAADEKEVKDILNKGYNLIKDILEKINNKMEIDVAAIWSDFSLVLKETGEEKEIKEFKERLLGNLKGITPDDQMKIGVMVKKRLDIKREGYAKEIEGSLRAVSHDSKSHELMDDKMVINSAFLINKKKRKDFDKRVEKLNAEFAERLNFRCVGPLPPYSFYTLEVKKFQFDQIDWAKKKLGLSNDSVTKDDIKRAHQAMALTLHPDKNPNAPGTEKEFDEITQAYNILWEYCQKDSCSFNEEGFNNNAILVKVRD